MTSLQRVTGLFMACKLHREETETTFCYEYLSKRFETSQLTNSTE